MCPRGNARRFILRNVARGVALAVAALGVPSARGDELLEYLEARGLDSLAAERIEALARAAEPADRGQFLDRLADLFSRMLDASPGGEATERLLVRAEKLNASLSAARADRLQVSIARTRYRGAAQAVEAIRAGIEADAQGAAKTLSEQAALLLAVAERADKRATDIDRRLERADGVSRDLLVQSMNEERGVAGQARYLAAWSLLYRGIVARSSADLGQAERLFIDMLGGRDGVLTPREVSEDLRSDESFASAVLGLALVKARTGGFAESTRWLALLETPNTFAAVRDNIGGWRMVAALDALSFKDARTALAALVGRDDMANWARVAAARSIEDGGSDAEGRALLREALAQLAAARDLGAVRALVARYGDMILGEDAEGFVPRYIRAVRFYDESQQRVEAAQGDSERLAAAELIDAARRAADALGSALAAADVAAYPEAASACRWMQAWSLRAAGDLAAAAELFEAVAKVAVGARAEESARMAIACLDEARAATREAAERSKLDAQLVARIEAFLARFPSSEYVPELLVRMVAARPAPEATDVDALLAIERESPQWLASRRQAAAALYRMFRGGTEPRVETGRRYLAVLAELPVDEANGLPASSASIARQALEVTLAPEMREVAVAARLLESLDRAAAAGAFDRREAEEELAYRRLQLAMYSDRWADVEAALAPFESPEATELWAEAALRLAVRGAEERRRAAKEDAPERGGYVATIVRAVDAILARAGGVDAAIGAKAEGEPGVLQSTRGLARIGLEARVELLRSSSDKDQGIAGLRIAEALLAISPRDASLLRATAVCAEAAGELDRAAEALRTLAGGLTPRTNAWFEAKVDQIRVLARLDPARARAVLSQYRALYPDLGPPKVRDRLLEIERELPPEPASPATADAPTGGGA